ncbi:SGNH/GDSL hydrolase family protein [Pendulispora albinea]|uniref:SGNH/GDSL hydrolase family protein n=1 Tax=Pendulispora albinea TaxID=2741071 RepID=A0ABZ2MD10_9BACT
MLALVLLLISGEALANTLTQNTSWTIDRANTSTKHRVVAYGDSIYAGYQGSLSNVARRSATWVQGEYLSNTWNADIEVIRRTKSGAKADDIYDNKIIAEKSYMQDASTKVVAFEMCGNDFLQARSAFAGQSGTCDIGVIDNALATCTKYQELAMKAINQYATTAKVKIIMNLYYPGYDADNGQSSCTVNGATVNKQAVFLPRLARSNYRACDFARRNGFQCVDAFAEFMGADYDANGDGTVDSQALRWSSTESEDQYVNRITSVLRSTIRDANGHLASPNTSYDYILSDNTHPTFSGSTIYVGFFGGTGTGSGAPDYSGGQIVNGKNPIYNQFGHERAGWAHSLFNPATP